jgi:hypothetical protein
MTADEKIFEAHLRRRTLLLTGVGGVAAAVVGTETAEAEALTGTEKQAHQPTRTPPVDGLHLQFGSDASSTAVVSWHTLQPVSQGRVLLGTERGYRRSVAASTRTYTDAKSGQKVYAHHAHLSGLSPATDYVFLAVHHGAQPEAGSLRTAPRGRTESFTFTSFGDQGTPTVGKKYEPPAGVTLPSIPWVNDNLGSPAAGDTTAGVERVRPLFHLFNGDLCYANLAQDRVRTWWDFWDNNTRSARHRPWMPSAGNHENELGNGPIGYAAYQTYFEVPKASGQTDVTHGLWYSFTAGAVRVISIANDDVTYQDGGNSYVRGYSHGAQRDWLESELRSARSDRGIDWVVICMHQVAISTADKFNGADLGIRQEWLPLFDRYGVDLVVCGHEHHYERSHPLRGHQDNPTLTPRPAKTNTSVIDTTQGTVHMIIGGGGTSAPSNQLFFEPAACRVITGVGPVGSNGKRPPVYVREDAPWSANRDKEHAYGFAAFTVDPGRHPGDTTRIEVTYYAVSGPFGALTPVDTFTLVRPRRDRHA